MIINLKSKKAFTLLEISVVILIIGILLVGTINFQLTIDKKSKQNITSDKIAEIEKAINEYILVHGKLPCPASINVDKSNAEIRDEDNDECTGYDSDFVHDGLIYGSVPTKTLNLTDDYAVDGWNNTISYIISKKYGDNKIFLADDTDKIRIENTSGREITSNAIYVLVSSGKNKSGAFRNGSQLSIVNSDLSDTENTFSKNFTNTFIKDVQTDEFDDIVAFKDKNMIILKDNMQFLIPCSLKDLSDLGDDWKYDAYPDCTNGLCSQGKLVFAKYSCTSNKVSKNPSNVGTLQKPTRRCLKYGKWSDVMYPCIDSCDESNIDSIKTNELKEGELRSAINLNYLKRAKLGETIKLECIGEKIGYIKLTCQSDGEWKYEDGDCYDREYQNIVCQNSQLNLNDKNFYFSNNTGETKNKRTVKGECKDGYGKQGEVEISATCQADTTWVYNGNCVQDCRYYSVTGGYWGDYDTGNELSGGKNGGYVSYGTKIKMVCDSDYILNGNSVAECRRGDDGVTDPNGWKFTETSGSCEQNVEVIFIGIDGAGSTSKTFTEGTSDITCNKSSFDNTDPANGKLKMCKIGDTIVAYEGDTFTVSANPTKTSKCIPYFIQNNIGSNAAHVNCASNTLCSNYAPTNEQTVYTSGSTLSGVSCATGYSSSTAPTVTCSNGTWTINNTCQQVCDSNNISLIAGSQLYKPNENSSKIGLISGTLFANGGVQDADCSSGYQEVCNTNGDCKVPGRSDNWQHFYRCENGSWKTYGSCFEGCKNDPTASSPFRKIENDYDTSPTIINGVNYYTNGAVGDTDCVEGYLEECGDSCYASTSNGGGSRKWNTWLQCENGSWVQKGTCSIKITCDLNDLRSNPSDNYNEVVAISEKAPGVPGSKFREGFFLNNYTFTRNIESGEVYDNRYFTSGTVLDATCYNDDAHGHYTEVSSNGQITISEFGGLHAYKCVNGEWKRGGNCIDNCLNTNLSYEHLTFNVGNETTTKYNNIRVGTYIEGYSGPLIVAVCKNDTSWEYVAVCDVNDLRGQGENVAISDKSPGVPGSKFRQNYNSSHTKGTVYNNNRYFTNGAMMDATCYNDDEHGHYTEVKSDEGPQLTNGFRPHAYICENGEWKRAGTCSLNGCYNSDLDLSLNAVFTTTGTTQYNETQIGTCNSGYNGTITATCQANGTWSYSGSCAKEITVTYTAVNGTSGSTSKAFIEGTSITCGVDAFGSDPAYGTFKMCKIGNTIVGYEGDTFTVSANPTKTSKCIPYFIQNNIGSNAAHVNCASNTLCSNYAPTNEQTVYTSGSTLSGVSCATGYSSSTAPTVTCSNGTWTINNTCQQVCDSNNISLIAGSQLYKPNENSSKIGLISGTLFANGGVQDADCSSGYQEVCNTNGDCKVPGRSDNWQHFYRCENGSWKTYGSCFEGCKNDPTASSPFRKIENGYNTSPTIINGVNYYTNGAVADTDCIDGYSEICNSCYASTSNGGGSRKWNTWLQCENGSWVQKGECKKKCSNSSLTFTNATFSSTTGTTNYKETKTGTCNSGYSGSITATCGENGSWSYSGSCTMRKCSEIVVPTKKGCTSYTRLSGSYQGTCADGSKNYYCPGSKIYVRFLHGTQECAGDAFWQSCGNDYNWTYGCMSKEVSASQNTCSGSSCKNVTSTLSCTLGEASSGQTKNCSASKTVTVKASSGCDSSCGDDEISISASGTCNGSAGWRNINTSTSCTNN